MSVYDINHVFEFDEYEFENELNKVWIWLQNSLTLAPSLCALPAKPK